MYIKTKIISKTRQVFGQTYYLYDNCSKYILSINFPPSTSSSQPYAHDTIIRTVAGMGGKIAGIRIYRYQNKTEWFYAYLIIRLDNDLIEINISCEDALKIALHEKLPIWVQNKILNSVGIKITKSLLESSLNHPI
ncbi:hypothetical protein A3K34_03920 [candidate division WWE3 bacterium RIFOXYC1_FULL_40_10]|uniref:BFN domain-containing protein n=1 Tax=candidate division WWE3 bacterium RIFOXYA2_FULL_46_9 TaxID=1802636 RepID=A0A1F4W0F2_UNCKA|nr:MAG: hypothetical protein A3K58_03920 [candidate division WWE3 bacterium RIFOXYB1_FULL_40_22]OGC61988.1 MAG: hypothetical protein A3K37_03920 [candidate division WWE3 bacterium RIFOXYA1_FULL_40_11]OGC62906.1 MAG: hypothetical protein A2264_03440 [candidate division WWE3 bacterium RIFOXYA2_FULL_46_9]OGC65068.1 MAG: hypothetical protein A2326_03455 [candidate division WWE3 bacterium RIFOXYB2_FULL_41_6]OGC66371.1 MAG: hypothetical protein A3K34_03920 [candidate division WWE3 bacterium RIFOXYC1_